MRKNKKTLRFMRIPPRPQGALECRPDGLYADSRGSAWTFIQRRVYRRGYFVIKEVLRPLNRPAPEGLPF